MALYHFSINDNLVLNDVCTYNYAKLVAFLKHDIPIPDGKSVLTIVRSDGVASLSYNIIKKDKTIKFAISNFTSLHEVKTFNIATPLDLSSTYFYRLFKGVYTINNPRRIHDLKYDFHLPGDIYSTYFQNYTEIYKIIPSGNYYLSVSKNGYINRKIYSVIITQYTVQITLNGRSIRLKK